MREKQKKESRKNSLRKSNGITLIALVVTIVVLLILAGVSISMLTGESGIISQAQKAKEQNEIGKEKEYINLAFTAVKGNKIANGDISAVTSTELQGEINKYTNEATVTGSGILKITYTSGREYEVDGEGNILSKESYDGMYSVGNLEGKIAPEDLFEYEIIDEQSKTARILRIKAEYCNIDGYNFTTNKYDVADTNGDIIYKGQKISDILVIPYEVTINGTKYLIKEANISAGRREIVSGITFYSLTLPNAKWIVYPNTIEKMEYYESRYQYWDNDYNRYSIVEDITFSDNIKTIGDMLNNTSWYESQPDGDLYINNLYYKYKGEMPENTNIIIKEGTIGITDRAFSNYRNLTNITIPDSVTSIGSYAFSRCENLTNITIPNSVTSIGYEAFYGTGWYENQPDGDLYIGKVYYGYKGEMPENTNIIIKEGTTAITDNAFYDYRNLTSITIPESVTSIGDYAFWRCDNLTSITIPDSVTSIGEETFCGCDSLTSITIPDSVTSIGDATFYRCSALTSITIPDSVTSIGDEAFEYCESLTSITIPDGVTSIGSCAFAECSSLTNITIPDSVTSIGASAFYGTVWYNNQSDGDLYIGKIYYEYKGEMPENTNIIIKEGTIGITDRAFSNYRNLTNITIPDSVTSIGDEAFEYCESLTSITIPNSVTSIEYGTFSGCSSLRNITVPDSVMGIEKYAFYACSSLTTVNYRGSSEQWEQIYIESYNSDLSGATINYNYTGE